MPHTKQRAGQRRQARPPWRALGTTPEPCGATAWQYYSDEMDEWIDSEPVLFRRGVATLDDHSAEALT